MAFVRQEDFSRLWDGYTTDAEARKARDMRAREIEAEGFTVRRAMMRNQMRKYAGLGQPDGGVCNVYMLNVYDEWN